MNARRMLLTASVFALFAAGCLPEKRIVWSPDGSRAAVVSDDGLRIATPDGKLSEPLIPHARRAAWFADGRRLLVITSNKRSKWAEVEPMLSAEERTKIVELGQALRTQVLAHTEAPENFKPKFAVPVTPGQPIAAALYVRDKAPEGMAEKLGNMWKELDKLEVDVQQALIFTLDGDKAVAGATITTGVDELLEPSVSPTGRHIAFIRRTPMIEEGDSLDPNDLVVMNADGPTVTPIVIEHVSFGYGWSGDGRSVALIHTPLASSKSVTVGAVATAELVASTGTAIDPSNVKVEDRVGLFFNQFSCVKYLPDGRLVFSAHPGTLPATDQEMPRSWSLYAWSPTMRASSTRLLARSADTILTDEQAMFEISPDGNRAVMNGVNGDTVVADLTNGEVSIWFDTKEGGDGLQSRPTWRTNDEICAVVPTDVKEAKPSHWSVMLLKGESDFRVISKDWSAAGQSWLKAKDEQASQPADSK